MRKGFKELPQALRRQVLFRAGTGGIFFLLLVLIACSDGDLYMILPCLFFGIYLAGSAVWLFYQASLGNYMRLQGRCVRVETTGLHRRIRAVYVSLEQRVVKVPVRQRVRRLGNGDTVVLYISEKTPVYEKDGIFIVGSYYAMEVRAGAKRRKTVRVKTKRIV